MILSIKHVTSLRLISVVCTFKPFISHNRIYRNRRKNFVGCLSCRIMTPIDKTPFICRFFRHFTQFSIGLLYKDVNRSDCTQRRDVTVSSETFDCFRNVFGKFKTYTFLTVINKLLLTKKFRKNVVCKSNPQIKCYHFKKMYKFLILIHLLVA